MNNQIDRHLGALEILFYTWDQSDPKHFLLISEVQGFTTPEDWISALAKVQVRHPMLSMMIKRSDTDLIFEPLTGKPIPLTIVTDQNTNLTQELKNELAARIDTSDGPLARMKIVHSNEKSTVIFTTHHSISDGLSTIQLLNDLLRVISGADLESLPLQGPMDDKFSLDHSSLARKAIEQTTPEYLKQHAGRNDNSSPSIELIDFSEELTNRIVLRSKEENTTVHGTLQAAAILSLLKLAPELNEELRILSPFSARKNLEIGENYGLFSPGTIIKFGREELFDFWELARIGRQKLLPAASAEALEAHVRGTHGLVKNTDDLTGFIEAHMDFDILLSNLGRFPFETEYGELKINSIYGPIITPGAGKKQAIGAVSVNNQLFLTHTSRHLYPGLLSVIKTTLSLMCDNN